MLAIDSETYPIGPGCLAPRPVCFSFFDGDVANVLLADAGAHLIAAELASGETLVGHSICYDMGVLAVHYPELVAPVFKAYDEGRIVCTKVNQMLKDIAEGRVQVGSAEGDDGRHGGVFLVVRNKEQVKAGYHLHDLTSLYLGRDRKAEKEDPDSYRLRFRELEGIDPTLWPDKARAYVLDDAKDPFEVNELQGHVPNAADQTRADFALHLMSVRGLCVDQARVDQLEAQCKGIITKTKADLLEQGIYRYEGPKKDPKRKVVKDTKEIARRVEAHFASTGHKHPLTDTGRVKCDRDTLKRTSDPLLLALADMGPADKVLQTFIPALRRGNGVPLIARFNVLVDSGRPSCADPNLLNLPRDLGVRECIVPRPGYCFASADYDCAELRSLAQVCLDHFKWSDLAAFFQANPEGDPHLDLAAAILGISATEAANRYQAGDPELVHMRQGSKALNFGLPGGLGVTTLREQARKQYKVDWTEDEARKRKEQWFGRWKEMRLYLNWVSRLTGPGTARVKQFRSRRIRGNVDFKQCANTFFQGLTADGAKRALWLVTRECYDLSGHWEWDTLPGPARWVDGGDSALRGSFPLIFLYDQIIMESPLECAHEAAKRMELLMVKGMREYLPDVPVTAKPLLMARWFKKARPVFDQAGRLEPWDAPSYS